MTRRTLTCLIAIAMMAACFSAGCNKFTRPRYETIYVGQDQFEVQKTLGEPYATFSDEWIYENEKPFYKAIIKFEGGKVSHKAWYDTQQMDDHPDLQDEEDVEGETTITYERSTEMVVE